MPSCSAFDFYFEHDSSKSCRTFFLLNAYIQKIVSLRSSLFLLLLLCCHQSTEGENFCTNSLNDYSGSKRRFSTVFSVSSNMSRGTTQPSKNNSRMDKQYHREYKARNILTLEERVQVIHEYERNPVYQRLAEKYNCSCKQIKNIISSKESVLLYFANRLADGSTSDERRQRQQKIAFLGKVIYEYIQRAVYHGVHLSAANVRQKALDVKESIAIMNFYPNNAWMQNFKTQYKVPDFDLLTLRQSLLMDELKEESFKAVDLIQFVSWREKQDEQIEKKEQDKFMNQPEHDVNGNHQYYRTTDNSSEDEEKSNEEDFGVPTVTYEKHDDREFDEDRQTLNSAISLDSDEELDEPPIKQQKHQATAHVERSLSPLPDIASYQEALRHLRVLEDFAMLGENFRAIGLLTQLQQVFMDPPNTDEFIA